MRADTPYDRSELYDLMARGEGRMAPFYRAQALALGPDVLELACGTGRIAIPLARAGLRVLGGDVSEPMLARARANAREAGAEIGFVALDMRDFDLGGRRFDLIFVAANSILHLIEDTEFSGFFASVARHLKPGGRLIFDAFIPDPALLAVSPDVRRLVGRFDSAELGQVTLEETLRSEAGVSNICWFW